MAGVADRLVEVDSDRSGMVIASVIQCIGWFLLAVPLVYLFKAASARAPQVRRGLIGLVIVAPIFLGLGGLLSAASVLDAATDFKNTPTTEIQACVAEKQDEPAAGDATAEEESATTPKTWSRNAATTSPATTAPVLRFPGSRPASGSPGCSVSRSRSSTAPCGGCERDS